MATSKWPDEVRIVPAYDYHTLLTDCKQECGSNILVHHETIETFQKYPPGAFMNPHWLCEGNFDDWLSKIYPSLGLTTKVSPL
jgi:hypothetical protein